LEFKEALNIAPLPVDEITAGVLGRHYAAGITAAGGREQAARAAVAAIFARRADETPSELGVRDGIHTRVAVRDVVDRLRNVVPYGALDRLNVKFAEAIVFDNNERSTDATPESGN
jgi:hypothetical protein